MVGMTLRSPLRTAVLLYIAGIAMWTSGEKTKQESGSCGCTWIIKTSRIRSRKANLVARRTRWKVSNLFLQALAEPFWHLKQSSVANQTYDISRPVQHCCAMCASTEMLLHSFAQIRGDLPVKVI